MLLAMKTRNQTLKMNTAQVVETSVIVNNISPIEDYGPPYDQTQPTLDINYRHTLPLSVL